MQDEHRAGPFTGRATAYLKAEVFDERGEEVCLSAADSPVLRRLAPRLLVAYVVDVGDAYELVQHRHLAHDGVDEATLHRIGVANLAQLVTERATRVQPYDGIFAVLMGGDFEASLVLVDSLWDEQFRPFVQGDYAVAVPARDVLAFCDASSTAGLHGLRRVIQRVFPTGDHTLSDGIYVRCERTWTPLAPD